MPKDPQSHLDMFRRDQSDSDGGFVVRGVMPGTYTLIAVEEMPGLSVANWVPGGERQELSKPKLAGFDRAQVLAPLVIGITGHRDIREEDRPKLEEKVKESAGVWLV